MQSGEFKNSSCGCLSVLHSWASFLGLLSFWPNKVIITGRGLQADICWGTSQAILFPCIIKEGPKLHRAPWWPGTVLLELHNSWNKKKKKIDWQERCPVWQYVCAYSLSPPSHFSSGTQGRAGRAQAGGGSAERWEEVPDGAHHSLS